MMKTNLLILSLFSLFFGCAKGVKTKAVFNLKSINNLSGAVQAISQNGMVIFGSNDKGHRFVKVMNTTDDFNHELDNGLWTFKAVAWQDSNTTPYNSGTADSDPFTGVPNCAITTISLNGSDASINLPLQNNTCELDAFGGLTKSNIKTYTGGAAKRFNPLKNFYTCDETLNGPVSNGATCDYDLATYISTGDINKLKRGYHSSFKLIVKSFYAGPNNSVVGNSVLESQCYDMTENDGGMAAAMSSITDLQIPSGPGLEFSVQGFYEPGCPIGGNHKAYALTNGLGTNNTDIKSTNDESTPGSEIQALYLRSTPEEVCASNITNPATNFAGGSGGVFDPYLICTARHINELYGTIGNPTPFNTNSFRILKDIDMNLETEEFYPGQTYHASLGHQIEPGKNFKPIGFNETNQSDAGINCSNNNPNPSFTGNFDGGKKTIKNLRMGGYVAFDTTLLTEVTCQYTGFFAKTSSGAIIARLNFENVEIENSNYMVGAIAGEATNSYFYEISVKKLKINAENSIGWVGGLVGYINPGLGASLKKIKVSEASIFVRNDGADINYVGGIVGKMNGGDLEEIVVEAEVQAETNDPSNDEALFIGGIAGIADGGGPTDKLAFYGSVKGNRIVGGIFGDLGSRDPSNVIAKANIVGDPQKTANCATSYIGGLFGDGGNNTIITSALFIGKLKFQNLACTVGRAGTISGYDSGTPALTQVYSLNPATSGTGPGVPGTLVNASDLRNNASTFSTTFLTSDWTHTNEDYPRLTIDNQQPCALSDNVSSISYQQSIGRGNATNPITICSSSQLPSISGSSHYKLLEDIIVDNSVFTSGLSIFSGILDGNKKSFYGLNHEFMSTNNGTIKNLNFKQFDIASGPSSLINTNNGTIYKVKADGQINGSGDASLLVNQNLSSGSISNVEVSGEVISNGTNVKIGLLAASNSGSITKAIVHGRVVTPVSAASITSGGVVGLNTGIISKSRISAYLDINGGGDIAAGHYFGGISGINSGNINNVEVERVQAFHMSGFPGQIGFVSGTNSGNITKVLAYYDTPNLNKLVGDSAVEEDYDPYEHYIINGITDPESCYSGVTTACDTPFADLKNTHGWDIGFFESSPGVISPVFLNYFLAQVTGAALPAMPTWEVEGSRFRLFEN